jgi:hypothetical protein
MREYYHLRKSRGVNAYKTKRYGAADAPDLRLRVQDVRVTQWASKARKNLKKSAAKRGIGWSLEITSEWIHNQYERQAGRCFYTGVPFEIGAEVRGMRRPSLDRRDSSRGYEPDNVVLCLVAVNYLKNEWKEAATLELIGEIRRTALPPRLF